MPGVEPWASASRGITRLPQSWEARSPVLQKTEIRGAQLLAPGTSPPGGGPLNVSDREASSLSQHTR